MMASCDIVFLMAFCRHLRLRRCHYVLSSCRYNQFSILWSHLVWTNPKVSTLSYSSLSDVKSSTKYQWILCYLSVFRDCTCNRNSSKDNVSCWHVNGSHHLFSIMYSCQQNICNIDCAVNSRSFIWHYVARRTCRWWWQQWYLSRGSRKSPSKPNQIGIGVNLHLDSHFTQ